MRREVLLSSAVAIGALAGYGGRAYSACAPAGGSTYLCSGAETVTQTISQGNAELVTAPGFSVDTSGTGGDAITVDGDGLLSYWDVYGSALTGTDYALGMFATGDDGATAGGLAIRTTGSLTGGQRGINVVNMGTGAVGITAEGPVFGLAEHGILVVNRGSDLTVVTGSTVQGATTGIQAANLGSGALRVTANGDVVGAGDYGIQAMNQGTSLTVTTGVGTTVAGYLSGIHGVNNGSGALTVTANGDVAGGAEHGIYVQNYGTSLAVTTGAGTTVAGGFSGIYGVNYGSGAFSVTANGDVTGMADYGIHARNYGTGLTVTTGAGATVAGDAAGIYATNYGSGALRIAAEGDVSGDLGIRALNGPGGTDLTVTTGADASVAGVGIGIYATNAGSGALSVVAEGDVSGAIGVLAANADGTDLTLATGPGATVTGTAIGLYAANYGSGALSVAAGGDVTGDALFGISVANQGTDLSVTTAAGATITGGVTGIYVQNVGSGALTVTAQGDVSGGYAGIAGYDRGSGLSVTVGADSTVTGGYYGILAASYGSGTLSIVAEGDVVGTTDDGIYAGHGDGGPIRIAVGRHGSVTSNGSAADDFALDLAGGPGDVTLAGTLVGGAGGALRFDPLAARDDRLELQPGAVVEGDVLAGLGTDSLVLGGSGEASLDLNLVGPDRQFRDFEILRKEGSSRWSLTGASGTIGEVAVTEGLLAVNGALPSADFTVHAGATLGGTGTLGSILTSGGAVAPGNSIGTLSVAGDVDFSGGGLLEIELDADGHADGVDAGGTIRLAGGQLSLIPLSALQEFDDSTEYTILTAGEGVVGSFDSVSSPYPFLVPTVGQDGSSLYLNLTRVSFGSVALTGNQRAVGTELDSLIPAETTPLDGIFDNLLRLSLDDARRALDSLSGVQHSHAQTLSLQAGRQFRAALSDRLGGRGLATGDDGGLTLAFHAEDWARQLAAASSMVDDADRGAEGAAGRGFWARGFGGFGDIDDTANASGADHRSGGVAFGADAGLGEGLVAGLAAGYLHTAADVAQGELEIESFQLAGYGGWRGQDYYLFGNASVGYHGIESSRGVTVGGFFGEAAADYDGWTGSAGLEAGRDFALAAGTTATPFAGLEYSRLRRTGFTEDGAGAANLAVEPEDQESLRSALGVRLAHSFETAGGMAFQPVLEAAWVRENLDEEARLTAGFAAAPATSFRIAGPELDRDRLRVAAGVAAQITEAASLGLGYRGEFAASDCSHNLSATLRFRF